MLTEQERKWLEERKKRTQHCDTCPNRVGYYELCSSCRSRSLYGLSLCPDYRDAAEFEARAKVIALHLDIEDVPCAHGMMMFCPAKHFKGKGCGDWCRMRMAHLQAEKEMDNERNHA
ncbi:hypothetical protein WCP94_004325 [Bilophila wadsworthia]|uniref:hypothetical protein n=1 Tax=Bilophila wadsworthia TaxID=35833 RepID=UPI003D6F297D